MSEDPDLERRLEAMFASARPRRGFEDDLWRRIEASRPWYRRLSIALRPSLRFAPALAAILVVALGATWLVGNHGFGGGAATTSSSTGSGAYGAQKGVASSFGMLPPLFSRAAGTAAPLAPAAGNADVSAGQQFSGTLPNIPPFLPVYRYDEPSAASLAAAATRLQAQAGTSVSVAPSDTATIVEPSFSIASPTPSAPSGGPVETASAFVNGHGITPTYPFELRTTGSARQVVYGRLFDGPIGPLPEVRRSGAPAGLTVDLGDTSVNATGPIDLPLATASYPLRSSADALSAVGVRVAAGPTALDHAQIAYVLVLSRGRGYYEPALLLIGPGVTILAPLVAPAWVAG